MMQSVLLAGLPWCRWFPQSATSDSHTLGLPWVHCPDIQPKFQVAHRCRCGARAGSVPGMQSSNLVLASYCARHAGVLHCKPLRTKHSGRRCKHPSYARTAVFLALLPF
jgi:hypothetical protein